MEKKRKKGIYEKYIKRLLDIILSLTAIILFSWLILIVAILVRIKLGSPIIFKQKRPGKDEKPFNMYKFRTMTDAKGPDGKLLDDDERLTKFGRMLRKTSLDELPELFNILFGQMSIVGTRPLLMEYLPYYTEEERHRHDVKPGLTGWAQVNGRNASSWEEKFENDLYYVNNLSFALDVKIVAMTVGKVLKGSDVLVGKAIPAGRLDDYRSNKKGI